MDGLDKQTDRLFIIFETIVKEGPLTLAELVDKTGIPRSAVHRTAQMLQIHGWIRARLSDHAYEASARFDIMMGSGHFAHPAVETHQALMEHMRKAGFSAALSAFIKRGTLVTIEATTKDIGIGAPLPLVNNAIALVALRQLEPVSRVRHLETYLMVASKREVDAIQMGDVARQLAADKPSHALIAGKSLVIPLLDKDEPGLTLSISPKTSKGRTLFRSLVTGDLTKAAILAQFGAV